MFYRSIRSTTRFFNVWKDDFSRTENAQRSTPNAEDSRVDVGRSAFGVSDSVRRIILTASGGPFRETPRKDFDSITPEQALKHPTWNMGPKITIDSATLFNKG